MDSFSDFIITNVMDWNIRWVTMRMGCCRAYVWWQMDSQRDRQTTWSSSIRVLGRPSKPFCWALDEIRIVCNERLCSRIMQCCDSTCNRDTPIDQSMMRFWLHLNSFWWMFSANTVCCTSIHLSVELTWWGFVNEWFWTFKRSHQLWGTRVIEFLCAFVCVFVCVCVCLWLLWHSLSDWIHQTTTTRHSIIPFKSTESIDNPNIHLQPVIIHPFHVNANQTGFHK